MLTLFTNRREMERCFDVVQPAIKTDDLRLVCQKWGVSVKGLRDDFLADEHLSLFALKSFFRRTGRHAQGRQELRSGTRSRASVLHATTTWRRYVLPQAVLETKGGRSSEGGRSGVLIGGHAPGDEDRS